MSEMIQRVTNIMYGVIAVLVLIIAGIAVFYFWSKKHRRAKVSDRQISASLNRKDMRDYIRIDNIKDDMIIVDNGTRFIGGIRCFGYDYYSASAVAKDHTVTGFINFISGIKSPVTYRQYTRLSNLEPTKEMYRNTHNKLLEELYIITDEYRETEEQLKSIKGKNLIREKELIGRIEEMQKQIKSLAWREYHMRDQMGYLDRISSDDSIPERVETYHFDWIYDPNMFSRNLSDEEIYKKAVGELKAAEHNMAYALSNAGVKAKRMPTAELVETCRMHFAPISARDFRFENVGHTSYYDDVIESDCVEESHNKIIEELGTELAGRSAQIFVKKSEEIKAELENMKNAV